MVKDSDNLVAELKSVLITVESAREMLQAVKAAIFDGKPSDGPTQRLARKKYILDTLAVTRWHKKVLKHQRDVTEQTISTEIGSYNKTLGKAARSNQQLEMRKEEYETLKASVSIPLFLLSLETVSGGRGNEIISKLSKDVDIPIGGHSVGVDIAKLFSIEKTATGHQRIDYGAFQELVELEYRSRLRKRIKLELLSLMISRIENNNKKWMGRERSLAVFMRRLKEMAREVESIKTSESSDLHEFDYEENMEEEVEEDDIEDDIEDVAEVDEVDDPEVDDVEPEDDTEEPKADDNIDDIELQHDEADDDNVQSDADGNGDEDVQSGSVTEDSELDAGGSRAESVEPEEVKIEPLPLNDDDDDDMVLD
ncbi:uncharacterized protein KQ657_002314 [Scheffersomyces spartinae]|uniref:Uncharacterized protein n=1 Tax=Scheffersomyces spartinae TaxID=45513 RepID=A0A9P7VD53_9ASCO|nr:uncharacterized protein KQ657_002314 [Scheffersomyces spartinae]KAG7195928.1 hypothetical protein KQ657_002314 [Scheffersomyces spartinae]